MRAKSLILIVIALGCGLVASIGISQVIERHRQGGESPPQIETEQIYVALVDININEPLTADLIKPEAWPKDRVPQGAIRKLEEVEGRRSKARLYAGEPILDAKLFGSDEIGTVSQFIPPGYGVTSVNVTAESAISGLLSPGDHVDVLVYLRKGGDVPETITRTLLRDVRIFAVNSQTEPLDGKDGKNTVARTVTLLLTPKQIEMVTLASSLGTLQLSLRRADDTDNQPTEGTTIAEILGASSERATPQRESGDDRDQQVAEQDILKHMMNQSSGDPQTMAEAAELWKMIIHSPQGVQKFTWSDEGELPNEVQQGGVGGPALPGGGGLPLPGGGSLGGVPTGGLPSAADGSLDPAVLQQLLQQAK